jgi:non-ribosomal peptide synthetase component E (peptide arylation enzyme)
MASAFGFGPDSVYLCPAPLYHAAPIGWSLGTQRHGGTVVLMDKFDPLECLRAIEEHRVTHVQFVPTHFVRMSWQVSSGPGRSTSSKNSPVCPPASCCAAASARCTVEPADRARLAASAQQ